MHLLAVVEEVQRGETVRERVELQPPCLVQVCVHFFQEAEVGSDTFTLGEG